MVKNKQVCIMILFLLPAILLGGCSVTDKEDKVEDLEFTVVEDAEIPQDLKNIIEEKKEAEFKLTYSDEQYLYLVVGYGQQQTGGYSISVNELYLSETAICVDVNLIGPSKDEEVSQAPSYPYIVVKIQYREEPVVFM